MALGPQRQVGGLTLNMAAEQPGEAGGMVCRVASSGVEVVGYVVDITDLYPIGIQLHDVEFINEGYQYNPWTQRGVREVSKPHEIVGISTNCIVDTNFVALGAQPSTGKFAYLAPSGLITDDASFGGAKVGKFLSDLNDRNISGLPRGAGNITIYGGGFFRGPHVDRQMPLGQRIQDDTVEPITYTSPGWVRVKIDL